MEPDLQRGIPTMWKAPRTHYRVSTPCREILAASMHMNDGECIGTLGTDGVFLSFIAGVEFYTMS